MLYSILDATVGVKCVVTYGHLLQMTSEQVEWVVPNDAASTASQCRILDVEHIALECQIVGIPASAVEQKDVTPDCPIRYAAELAHSRLHPFQAQICVDLSLSRVAVSAKNVGNVRLLNIEHISLECAVRVFQPCPELRTDGRRIRLPQIAAFGAVGMML